MRKLVDSCTTPGGGLWFWVGLYNVLCQIIFSINSGGVEMKMRVRFLGILLSTKTSERTDPTWRRIWVRLLESNPGRITRGFCFWDVSISAWGRIWLITDGQVQLSRITCLGRQWRTWWIDVSLTYFQEVWSVFEKMPYVSQPLSQSQWIWSWKNVWLARYYVPTTHIS